MMVGENVDIDEPLCESFLQEQQGLFAIDWSLAPIYHHTLYLNTQSA